MGDQGWRRAASGRPDREDNCINSDGTDGGLTGAFAVGVTNVIFWMHFEGRANRISGCSDMRWEAERS